MKAGGVLFVIAIALIVIAFGVAFGLTKESATSAPPAMAQVGQALPEAEAEAPAVVALWRKRGCAHGHNYMSARRGVKHLVRNHRPNVNKKRVGHYKRCVQTPKQARRIRRFAKASWDWRHQYEHVWVIKFNSLPTSWQNWAYSTSSCEAGMNPATNTGNGFLGAFQFLASTWAMAGGTGLPHQHSWHYQAWIAVHWRMRSSQAQWPNCAPW